MATITANSPFMGIPDELLFQIADLLDMTSKCRAMKADRTLRRILRDESLWHEFVVEDGTKMTLDAASPLFLKMTDAIHYVSLGDDPLEELYAPFILDELIAMNGDVIKDMRLSLHYDSSCRVEALRHMESLHTLVLDTADGLACYLDDDEDFCMPSGLKHLEMTIYGLNEGEILRAEGLKTLKLRSSRDTVKRFGGEPPEIPDHGLMLWGDELFADSLETLDITGFRTKVGMVDDCGLWLFEVLTTLRLEDCFIDTQGEFPTSLQTLTIINCLLSEDAINAFEQSLWPNIRKIHIEKSGLDLYSIERSLFIPPEEQAARTLQDLTLILESEKPAIIDHKDLLSNAMDVESLMEVYGDSLKTLSLTFANSLGNSDLTAIGENCRQLHSLKYLSPSGATFEGIIQLLEGVADQLKDLWVVTSSPSCEIVGTAIRLKELCKSHNINAWVQDVDEEDWTDVASF